MKADLKFIVSFDNAHSAQAALMALEQEKKSPRSDFLVSCSGNQVLISISAQDATALRATANSSMRVLQTIESIENTHKGV